MGMFRRYRSNLTLTSPKQHSEQFHFRSLILILQPLQFCRTTTPQNISLWKSKLIPLSGLREDEHDRHDEEYGEDAAAAAAVSNRLVISPSVVIVDHFGIGSLSFFSGARYLTSRRLLTSWFVNFSPRTAHYRLPQTQTHISLTAVPSQFTDEQTLRISDDFPHLSHHLF